MKLNLAMNAKNILFTLKNNFSASSDVELEQAKLRIKVECVVLLYLLASYTFSGISPNEVATLFYLIGFIGIAVALFRVVRKNPGDYLGRKLFAVILDAVAITFFMYRGGETAAIMFPLYLWVTLGHGFRFGTKYLVLSQFANITGFLILCSYNPFWQEVSTQSIFLLTLVVIPFYAITLIKKLTQAAEKAKEASEEKTRFVSNMSHEIRTPLHGIIGISELLSIRKYDDEYQGLCDSLSRSASVLLRLVNDVLDFSRIESGKLEISRKPFNLYELMEDTTKVFQGEAARKNIQVKLAIAPALQCHWIGDAQHIQQILINLIGNSIKFTQDGSIDITVEALATEPENPWLRFSVQDTGIGIPAKDHSKIFERFTQANNSGVSQYQGTGLGTTIAKQLVEAMGGTISFTSIENAGSTFWFDLPIHYSEIVQSNVSEHSNLNFWVDNKETQYRKNLKILVAEDNETNQLIINKILEKSGFQFDLVSDGEEALDTLLSDEYDVALLDMQMPHMSGMDVCKAYKMIHPADQKINFIMLSANVDQRERDKAIKIGFSECLPKPIESAKLLSLLDKKAHTISKAAEQSVSPALSLEEKADFQFINRTVLRELAQLSNNKEFLHNVIASFNSDVLKSIDQMEQNLCEKRYMELKRHAHAVRGTASNLGVIAISRIAVEIEKMNPLQTEEKLPALLNQLRVLHVDAVRMLTEMASILEHEGNSAIH